MNKKPVALILLLLGAAGLCQAQSEQQSLGDVARHHSPHKKASLVVTEDNIASVSGTISVVGSDTVQMESPAAAASVKTVVDKSQAEAAPAESDAQVAELKKKLDEHKQELEGWKQAAKHYQDLLATETDEFRRQTYETALANDRANIERSRRQVDEAQNVLNKAQQALNDKPAK
jgi:hypothetical protein